MKETISGCEICDAMCGGVISQTLFDSEPMAYLMAYVLPDDKFKEYAELKRSGKDKEATKIFNKFARSNI